MRRTIYMIGAFPPPVHGMAAVNAAVRERFANAGGVPVVIDLSASSLDRSLVVRLKRLPRVVHGIGALLFRWKIHDSSFYISISGGFGQIYEILFVLLSRLRWKRVYLHHHSFAYIDKTKWITRILTWIAGPRSVHITQSQGMATRLCSLYSSVHRVVPISNVIFFINGRPQAGTMHNKLKTIGFLSNISAEKGVFVFLDLVAAYEAEGLDIHAKLAGPFQDSITEQKVRKRILELHSIEYVGPQYGETKEAFLSSIDVLIFPTMYDNETEGIVNHEAMSHGVPVIAYGRGCIPEFIGTECGLVIDPSLPFIQPALVQLKQWLVNIDAYKAVSRSSIERFACAHAVNSFRWCELEKEILGSFS